jgi:hypothetical protein
MQIMIAAVRHEVLSMGLCVPVEASFVEHFFEKASS